MRQFWGGKSGTYKIKLALFLFAFGLLAATKTLFKRKKKILLQYRFDWGSKLLLTHCTLTMEIEQQSGEAMNFANQTTLKLVL